MARTRKVPPTQEESAPGEEPPPDRLTAPQSTPEPSRPAWSKWLVQLLLPLAAGAGLIAGLIVLGNRARDQLRQEGQDTIAFSDIECDPPAGVTRQEFLEEAQYLADLPDRINLLDPDANARIASGLAEHPWVDRVKLVEQLPFRRVRAELLYRVGVLSVADPGRIVDRHGVLLPASADNKGLPVLRLASPASVGWAGQGLGR